MHFLIVLTRLFLGTAPITVSMRLPPLKIIVVGIDRTPYSDAMSEFASVSSFTYTMSPVRN